MVRSLAGGMRKPALKCRALCTCSSYCSYLLGVFLLYNTFRRACVFVCVLYLEHSCVVLFQHVRKVGGGPTHSLYLCVPGFTLISS